MCKLAVDLHMLIACSLQGSDVILDGRLLRLQTFNLSLYLLNASQKPDERSTRGKLVWHQLRADVNSLASKRRKDKAHFD